MHAAVVTDTEKAPEYADFRDPEPRDGLEVAEVLAAGVTHLVRGIAAGRHYSAAVSPPFVPGVDGVVRLADGRAMYVSRTQAPFGTLAERTLVDEHALLPLPDGLDAALGAAVVNPGFSGWLPLSDRLVPGGTVLVIGATGAAGGAAVQVAKALGAGRVVAAGRSAAALERLPDRGADAVVDLAAGDDLAGPLARAADGYDLVLDYVWGGVAERALAALVANGIDPRRPVEYVNVGGLAGPSIALDATLIRSANLRISGSGIGSSAPERYRDAAAASLRLAAEGLLTVDFERRPLAEVGATWSSPNRLVYIP